MTWESKPNSRPHPANCSGDFYVEDGCCITCGVPLIEAPDVFGWAEEKGITSCVVVKQPTTSADIDRTLAAMWAGEVKCIRYRGNDADVGRRLVEAGLADQCDQSPPADAALCIRSHVAFQTADNPKFADTAQLARAFLAHFMTQNEDRPSGFEPEARLLEVRGDHAAVEIAWVNSTYHAVEFKGMGVQGWLVITHPSVAGAAIGLSRVVDRWLQEDGHFVGVRWFSAEQWQAGGPYLKTVI